MLQDANSHISLLKEFPDVDAVIARAEGAGVTAQILIGYNMRTSREAVSFVHVHKDKKFWCAVGIHPHDATEATEENLMMIEEMASGEEPAGGENVVGGEMRGYDKDAGIRQNAGPRTNRVVAIGEIGLDYFRNLQPVEVQKKAFRAQLEMAMRLDLPVILHVRKGEAPKELEDSHHAGSARKDDRVDNVMVNNERPWNAQKDVLDILAEVGNTRVVMHSFSGGPEEARICFERGYYLSFSGPLTYPKNDQLREIAVMAPIEKVLIETDCPYLPPQKYRGQRNEPAYVVEVAKELMRINKMNQEEFEKRLQENFEGCFKVTLSEVNPM